MGLMATLPWWRRMFWKAAEQVPVSVVQSYVRHRWREWKYDVYAKEGYGQNPYVFNAIGNRIAPALGSLEWGVYRQGEDGPVEIPDHPLLELLYRPNRWMGGSTYLQTVATHLLVGGQSFTVKVGPQSNRSPGARDNRAVKTMHPYGPDVFYFERAKNTIEARRSEFYPISGFVMKTQSSKTEYAPEDVIYLRCPNPLDPVDGYPPLHACAQCVDLNNEARIWNMSLLRNGARPSGVFTVDGALSDDEFERGREQIGEQYSGALNAGRPMLLEGGAKWQSMSLDPNQMAWDRLNAITGREISMVLNVPTPLVESGDMTYQNFKAAMRALWTDAVLPLADMIRDEFNVQLVPDFASNPRQPDIWLDYKKEKIAALQDDEGELIERTVKAVEAGLMTINEGRSYLGREPIEGGDVPLVGSNRIPIDLLVGEGAASAA